MQPRWLVTLDDNLQPLNVTVRVGQVIITARFEVFNNYYTVSKNDI